VLELEFSVGVYDLHVVFSAAALLNVKVTYGYTCHIARTA
jgi:hypothetical protein